jgi:pilus assembly protein CpaE
MNALAQKVLAELPVKKPSARIVELFRVPHITLHAFCDTPEIVDAMERAVSDRRMSRAHCTVHPGGIAAAIDLYRDGVSPSLVVIESRAAAAELHAQLNELADTCQSSTKVIVIGYTNDVAVYRELLTRGVSEYIVAPTDSIAIVGAVSRLYQDAGAKKLGRSLAFVGARGGVGSSTIANNVASTIARTNDCDVILADLDLPFGSASLDFNLEPTQGIAQALQDSGRLDDLLLERLLTKCEDHLSVLTAPATLMEFYDLEEDAVVRVIELAQNNVPFVVLNVPHIWSSWTKKTLLMADEVVITAAPDLTSLRNAKNIVDLLKQARPNDAPPRLVLNQIGMPKRSEIKPAKFAEALGMELTACISFDPSTFSAAANRGQMIADVSGNSAMCASFVKIAQIITGSAAAKPRAKTKFALASLWGG